MKIVEFIVFVNGVKKFKARDINETNNNPYIKISEKYCRLSLSYSFLFFRIVPIGENNKVAINDNKNMLIINIMKVSVIIPAYNEYQTIEKIINKVIQTKLNLQIIVIDDFSSDGTRDILLKKCKHLIDELILHNKNLGKGAAIKSAQKKVNGDCVIIQDADLEYDPSDYKKLIKPIMDKSFKVVYGSRVLGKNRYSEKNFTSKFRVFFNHILTIFTNFLFNQNLTDAHTCYKTFETNLFKKINLEENDFAFCPEITAKTSKLGIKICEVPINYKGRSYQEGKKISIYDGFRAIYVLLKYKLVS